MNTSNEPRPGRSIAYLLDVPIDQVKNVGSGRAKRFTDEGIASVGQLLFHVPRRYLDRSQLFDLSSVPIGEEVTVGGVVSKASKRRISKKRTMVEATIGDGTSTLRAVWFNPYLRIAVGQEVALSGKVETYRGSLQMKSPDLDRLDGDDALVTGRVLPIYSKAGGMKPRDFLRSMENALRRSRPITEIVPADLLDRLGLVGRDEAFGNIHFPEDSNDVGPARQRLIFDEFLRIQMALKTRAYDDFESQKGVSNSVKGDLYERFNAELPYRLTADQEKVIGQILGDMESPKPMHRLLQGEVGSGKTVVVVIALLTSVESGHQGAFMAPTEVLAAQHYLGTELALEDAGLAPPILDVGEGDTPSLFQAEPLTTRGVRIGLFTSNKVTTNFVLGDISRSKGLAWLRDGTIDIAFGTQALIQSDVEFHSLGIAVVDEQHRFGVEQRVVLRDKNDGEGVPDLLLMTATPIPRTLAMAAYGDLDVSTIVEMPAGRTNVVTETLPGSADGEIDRRISATVAEGRQVFVVCPLIDDSDKLDARSATTEFERLKTALPDVRCDLLHGQMRSDEKAAVMHRVKSGDIDVLVSTTVIEVGIDIQNATLMVIRNADRFGLSQLHQLRGRVGRGDHAGTCLLVADPATPDGERRIEAMVGSNDGFELARVDLEIRGQGTVFGGTQSGAADLRLGDILRDHKLLTDAHDVAEQAVRDDPNGAFVGAVMHEAAMLFGDSAEWLTRS
ncbi:MAG: ATP-dependent DNA helicase RecG [Actinomycetota bacterium]|nr:ATP-dependent DNA helicase RecG [Actinomycetota bacterium]